MKPSAETLLWSFVFSLIVLIIGALINKAKSKDAESEFEKQINDLHTWLGEDVNGLKVWYITKEMREVPAKLEKLIREIKELKKRLNDE